MPAEISASERQEYRDAFELFDKDGSGSIDTDELAQVLRLSGKELSEKELKAIVKEVDTDGSGEVDFEEFCTMMQRLRNTSSKQDDDKESFAFFEKDGSGYITVPKLLYAMKILGEDITESEARLLIDVADKDGDGRVSFNDFKQFFA